MSIREQFKKECCDVVFENHCIGNQVDCDKCYIKYLEQQNEAKDKVIEKLRNQLCKKEEDEYKQDAKWFMEQFKKDNYKIIT